MTKPATLDKTRSYGTVYGGAHARYQQDHKEFDHQGVEIMPNGKDMASEGDYADWPWKRLQAELKELTGKGPAPGTTKGQIIETLRSLDAAEANAEPE